MDEAMARLQAQGLIEPGWEPEYATGTGADVYDFTLWTGENLRLSEAEAEMWLKGVADALYRVDAIQNLLRQEGETT